MTTNNNGLLTTADVATELGLSARHVRKLAKDKKVGRQITRGVWLFSRADVERLKIGR